MERPAMFVAVDGSTLLQAAKVTDMSRDGLHLVTRQPAPIGTVIEIEMEPRESSARTGPIITRGRIVRVRVLPDGEYSVGVKLRYRAGKTSAVNVGDAMTTPASPTVPAVPATSKSRIPKLDWRHGAVIGFFAAVIALLVLWPRDGVPRAAANGASGEHTSLDQAIADFKQRPKENRKDGSSGAARQGYSVRPPVPSGSIVQRTQDRVSRLDGKGVAASGDANASALAQSVLYERSVSDSIGVAESPITLPSGGGVSMLAGGVRTYDDVSGGGGSLKGPLFENERELAELVSALVKRANSDPFEATNAPSMDRPDSVHLEIDQDAYTLTVYRNGKPFTRYPISLGANGSTPTGTFTIYNKIQNPDWYNRGESVPFGDPRNPLGASWMGFEKNGKALSYGIHPTNDVGAIGKPAGRGCIRLKPEHAEALFRMCPVGATVTVR